MNSDNMSLNNLNYNPNQIAFHRDIDLEPENDDQIVDVPESSTESDANKIPADALRYTFPYKATESGIYFIESDSEESVQQRLTYFDAEIKQELNITDGLQSEREYIIAGKINGKVLDEIHVSAKEFASLKWISEKWGHKAIFTPTAKYKNHIPNAISLLSLDAEIINVYQHTGWVQVRDRWYYLHAGGAIGSQENSDVNLTVNFEDPQLTRYSLPTLPSAGDLQEAIQTSIKFLDLAPGRITYPLLAATFLAPLATILEIDFSLFLAGESGSKKSTLAGLALTHMGSLFNYKTLPGNWASTDNALEKLSFLVKDSIFVVDDFAPTGNPADIAALHRKADRLLRAQGNLTGRQRMRPSTKLNNAYYPRGLIVATGESVPKGQSLRGRMFIVDMANNETDMEKLTFLQQKGKAGVMASTMTAYLHWLAPKMDSLKQELPASFETNRDKARELGLTHDRTPEILANLLVGLQTFLWFGLDKGALTKSQSDELLSTGWEALIENANKQGQNIQEHDPVHYFWELLVEALANGKAHIQDGKTGQAPHNPAAWGWKPINSNNGVIFKAKGKHIGWVDNDDLYLSEAAFDVVRTRATAQAKPIPLSNRELRDRMKKRGLLAGYDANRNTKRSPFGGNRSRVIHVKVSALDR